ncbi:MULTISPECIES: hypothetical protein [Herbaspirillum]|uniref:Uncharacterized protein n=2 Tax=Herbaspirillum huttiense TaxID=863372 RepID=A0AAJ2HAN0_9BURK|nr:MULTISPECIES: hypothetical protein [Herbaspirillum]MDR9836981.1 hypothetical protein [Herbaspirillum huttiense]
MAARRIVTVGIRVSKRRSPYEKLSDEDLSSMSVEWHAPSAGEGDYSTLCGMESDDPSIGLFGRVPGKPGQKITCAQCKAIWRGVVAQRLRESDFE